MMMSSKKEENVRLGPLASRASAVYVHDIYTFVAAYLASQEDSFIQSDTSKPFILKRMYITYKNSYTATKKA